MNRTAIVLAGGSSTRLGNDKGLMELLGKPLVKRVFESIGNLVDERIAVVSSASQAETYRKLLGSKVDVLVDAGKTHAPLMGALTGFKAANGEHSLLLPCDAPFVSRGVLLLLFELCMGRAAAIPRWPNGFIEPLHAVYHTKPACLAAEHALSHGELRVQALVDRLKGVRFVSTLVLQQLDQDLRTFTNVNTSVEFKRAESMLKR